MPGRIKMHKQLGDKYSRDLIKAVVKTKIINSGYNQELRDLACVGAHFLEYSEIDFFKCYILTR